jgi:hypothetical protein
MGGQVMGAHSSTDDTLAAVESDAVRVRAAALAGQMTDWLGASVLTTTPLYPEHGDKCSAELENWCRSARDVMEALARG